MQPGFATAAGTARYGARFAGTASAGHFRQMGGLMLASVGIGTYLGEADDLTDERYRASVRRTVDRGGNVIDTASNYRFQRSERAIGKALGDITAGGIGRDELFITTKGGYLPFDGAPPVDFRRYVIDTVIDPGLAKPEDIVQGHCMTPAFIRNQLAQSRQNLGLETIDGYYVHNPESQLQGLDRQAFEARLQAAFETLEAAVADGKVRVYGVATWNGFRMPPDAVGHHSLLRLLTLAEAVGGANHHFRIIQLPLNLVMTEAANLPNHDGQTVLEVAAAHGMTVMTSASILQAQLARQLPAALHGAIPDLRSDAQRALQFTRSVPGVTTALVGMSRVTHVEENLQLADIPPLAATQVGRVLAHPL